MFKFLFVAVLKVDTHKMLQAFVGMSPASKVCYLNIMYTETTEYNMMKVVHVIYLYLQVFGSV